MSERTGMTVSQVTDEALYAGLVEMQEVDAKIMHLLAAHRCLSFPNWSFYPAISYPPFHLQ